MNKSLCGVLVLPLVLCLLPAVALAQSNDANNAAAVAARAHFAVNAAAYGLTNPVDELSLRSVRAGRGITHVRFNQLYRGLPVFGGEAIAHVQANGTVRVTNALRGRLNVDPTARIDRDSAILTAAGRAGIRGTYSAILGDLKVLPSGDWSPRAHLVWHVRVLAENDLDVAKQWDVFVDAHTGNVVFAFDSLHTQTAGPVSVTGNTMWSGSVQMPGLNYVNRYWLHNLDQNGMQTRDMNNSTSGIGQVVSRATAVFGNGNKNNGDDATAAADAHFGGVKTWEYFQNTFGRNGIDGAGRKTFSRVHYGRRYENAFWQDACFCMTYGDGFTTFFSLTSIDVAGHEMAHGVMSTEANLNYFGESGGLNESSSDIFGTMVEHYINNSEDTPEYWIGERIYRANWPGGTYVQNFALRYMDEPNKDGSSPNCWFPGLGNLDVHYSSGPSNHMFYLMAEGGTSKCNANNVAGIGRPAASAIWYNAISNYMTTTTNYAGARAACLNSAAELYGNGSTEYNAVAAAFSAINVN